MATYVTLPMDMNSDPFMHLYSVVHQAKTLEPDLETEKFMLENVYCSFYQN